MESESPIFSDKESQSHVIFCQGSSVEGFRKIDSERWEFANEDFVKDQKHLLKNIHRRKPIHSHSHPQGSTVDPERAAFEEQIERLSRDKAALEAEIFRLKQQKSAEKLQLEDLSQRVNGMVQRQGNLWNSLEKAIQSPTFVEHLLRKIESKDFSAYNKKRRLPQLDHSQPVAENSFMDNHSSSRHEFGNIFHQEFSNKLNLELSPAVSDINLVSRSTQSSNEDGTSPQRNISEGDPKDVQMRAEGILLTPEPLELSDTGTSFTFKMETSFLQKAANESPRLHSLQQSLNSTEEGDGLAPCDLNLTIASSSLQANRNQYSARMPQLGQDLGKSPDSRSNASNKETDFGIFPKNRNSADEDATLSSSQEANNQGPAPAQAARVNDVFWEQFLTERPGSSDTEEASSSFRANPYDDQEDRRSGHGMSRNVKNMDQLTL